MAGCNGYSLAAARTTVNQVLPCLILLIAAWHLFAQQEPIIRLDVQQVLVPVVVTDKKGHHVGGLHASDFHIFEDGVPQEIASFSSDTAGSVDDIGAEGIGTVRARSAIVPRVSRPCDGVQVWAPKSTLPVACWYPKYCPPPLVPPEALASIGPAPAREAVAPPRESIV